MKIAIIGSPGAGKTTLARRLGKVLDIKAFHLDHRFWETDWREKPRNLRIEMLEALVQKKDKWIIEGSYLSSSEPRLREADTIIFLDAPPRVCLKRLLYRHFKERRRYRLDLPKGCSDRLTLKCILKVLAFPFRGRWQIERKLRHYGSKRIIQLCSDEDVAAFLGNPLYYLENHNMRHHKSLVEEDFFVSASSCPATPPAFG